MGSKSGLREGGGYFIESTAVIIMAVGEQEQNMWVMLNLVDNCLRIASRINDNNTVLCLNKEGIYLEFSGYYTGYPGILCCRYYFLYRD